MGEINLKKMEAECRKKYILELLPYAIKYVEDEDFERAFDCITTAMNDIVAVIKMSCEARK